MKIEKNTSRVRDCAQIMWAIFGGLNPPPIPLLPLSAIASNWLTPPSPLRQWCQHFANPRLSPVFSIYHNLAVNSLWTSFICFTKKAQNMFYFKPNGASLVIHSDSEAFAWAPFPPPLCQLLSAFSKPPPCLDGDIICEQAPIKKCW